MNSQEIIDIHPHIISTDAQRYPSAPLRGKQSDWSRERPQTFEQLIAQMDDAGVAKAAIVQASTYYGVDNSYLADSIAKNPQRFTGVCTIDTLAPDAIPVLEGWMRRSMTGLRIFTGGSTHGSDESLLDDPRSWPVWEFAGVNGVSICVQTNQAGWPKVRSLLQRFPGTRLVLDHSGRPKLDDGPPYEVAKALFELAEFPNLYLKITPRSFELAKSGKSTPEAFFSALVSAFGANRMAFGSNLPANEGPMRALVAEARAGLSSLSAADQAKVFAGTARLLYPALA
jgi:predicted TIM-barrel fold metal-dependent hydrolase